MSDPFFDRGELDKMSDEQLLDKLDQSVKDAEAWEAENPDPQR